MKDSLPLSTRIAGIVVILLGIGAFFAHNVLFETFVADRIDGYLYVDNRSDKDYEETGSFFRPFKTIAAAVAVAEQDGTPDTIVVLPGEYTEKVDITGPVTILGLEERVILRSPEENAGSTIYVENAATVAFLEIDGGNSAIKIGPDASLFVIGSKLYYSRRYGVWSKSGDQVTNRERSVVVTNSEITYNGKQGLYLFDGKAIITDNVISNNDEEGVDLHEDMDVLVYRNTISDNGEGGIETEIGFNRVEMHSNTIERNGSSGINMQTGNGVGEMHVINNTITQNTDYGIRCAKHDKIPEDAPRPYFPSILTRKDNKIGANGKENFSVLCLRDGSAEEWKTGNDFDLVEN